MSSILTIILLIYTTQIYATIYGIAGPNYKDGVSSLVSYDPHTGSVTTVVSQRNPLNPIPTAENLGCFDNINNIYYFISSEVNTTSPTGYTTVLFGYNLKNIDSKLIKISLDNIKAEGITGTGDACVGNNNGDIFVFGHDTYNRTNQLLLKINRIDDSNVDISIVGQYSNIDNTPLLAGNPTILDTTRNYLWVSGSLSEQQMYFYINLKTGRIENSTNFHDFKLITGSIYNSKYDNIIGITFNGINTKTGLYAYELNYENSINLEISKKFVPDMIGYCGQLKSVTQDIDNGILYSLMSNNTDCNNNYTNDIYLVGTSIESGQQLSSVRIAQLDGAYNDAPYDIQYYSS